jgi:SAM-dependent methyltransferase
MALRSILKKIPILRDAAWRLRWIRQPFRGSANYWEARYASHGNSGRGSEGAEAEYKAEILNRFVREQDVRTVLEFGCGDGRLLQHLDFPRYHGFDVSPSALATCRRLFASDPSKSFSLLQDYHSEQADLSLSIDIIYHLVEEDVFGWHLQLLFQSAGKFVIIYSSHSSENRAYRGSHIYQREFLPWIQAQQPSWEFVERIPTPAKYRSNDWMDISPEFFFFRKRIE